MQFRTELHPTQLLELPLKTKFYSIGSCFADAMGERLQHSKFETLSNPFGIIYNPINIFQLLSGSSTTDNSYIEQNNTWYNYKVHSDLRSTDKSELENQIKSVEKNSSAHLNNADVLIITLGTAYVYKLVESDEIVANCHKVPQKHFKKELLSVKQIIEAFEKSGLANKNLKIIFTVSPVRHVKDTLELNNVSKSILRVACHELQKQYEHVHYFPAYEMLIDDLRDYRFYKDDLLHPTTMAEDYIWEKFTRSIFDNDTLSFIEEWREVKHAMAHRPFNPETDAHQRFINKQIIKLETLNEKVDCIEEITFFKKQLK